jgi:hypothetical protein
MRYSLRTLLVLLALFPPILAWWGWPALERLAVEWWQDHIALHGAWKTAKSIEGDYLLYRWEDQEGMPVRTMTITAGTGQDFSIRGLDEAWSGQGRIDGNHGYYHWAFATGEMGKSTFTINRDGTLKGEVRGEIVPWSYLARPSAEGADQR